MYQGLLLSSEDTNTWTRISSVQFSSSVTSDSLQPHGRSTPGFPVHHQLPELAQTHVHWVGDAIQPSYPVLPPSPLPSILSCIRVFSNESALHIRWPKYWSFSFSISLSNEYSEWISFRIDWFDLLAVQASSPASQFENINSLALRLLCDPTLKPVYNYWKNHGFD